MPLYVKDPLVDKLMEDFLLFSGQTNKTEAVRHLLTEGLRRLSEKESLTQRIRKLQDQAAKAGFGNPFADERGVD